MSLFYFTKKQVEILFRHAANECREIMSVDDDIMEPHLFKLFSTYYAIACELRGEWLCKYCLSTTIPGPEVCCNTGREEGLCEDCKVDAHARLVWGI